MELEHAFQQSGFVVALQLFIAGALFVPGVLGRNDIYRTFASSAASYIVSFGPMGMLVYVLYRVSHLC